MDVAIADAGVKTSDALMASWRSGYAEDCKSLYGGSIPSEASRFTSGFHAMSWAMAREPHQGLRRSEDTAGGCLAADLPRGNWMADFAALRRNMVDCQLRTYDVTDRAVLAAMDAVPREMFVPPSLREIAYIDQPVALDTFGARGRQLLAPMTSGRMLQTLDVQPGQTFLDYACGTGYTSAVAARLGAIVTAYDTSAELRHVARGLLSQPETQSVVVADTLPTGPFDLIFVNGSCEREPDELFALLGEGGKLVLVQGGGRSGRAMLHHRAGTAFSGRAIFDTAAHGLEEFRRIASFAL